MLCSVSMPANLSSHLQFMWSGNFPQIIITYLLSDIVICQVLFKAYSGLQCHSIGNGSMLHSSCSKPEVAPFKPSCQTGWICHNVIQCHLIYSPFWVNHNIVAFSSWSMLYSYQHTRQRNSNKGGVSIRPIS